MKSLDEGAPLVTSAAVIFEVIANIDPAMQVRTDFLIELIRGRLPEVWDLEAEDVFHAQRLEYRFQELHGSSLPPAGGVECTRSTRTTGCCGMR